MNKFCIRVFRLLTIVLFVSPIVLLSTIKVEAAFPSDPDNWTCSPYCCDGKDGNKKPRANTAAGEIDNFADACSRPASSACGGSGRFVGCPPGPLIGDPPPCNACWEHEKCYSVPSGSTCKHACNPVYKVCKPKGPVCGNSKKEGTEECDPKDTSCTQDGQNGICTASCKCCVRCSVQCPSPLIVTAPVNPPHPIDEYSYLDIVSCTDETDCSEPRDHPLDCFEVPSLQPSVRLEIYPESVPTYLGFNSDTHTGGGIYIKENDVLKEDNTVNDFYPYEEARYSDTSKLFYMEATFEDSDNPIESTYFWFNKSGNKPITPSKIDLDNNEARTDDLYGTNNNESFGFMLYNKGGAWVPYIPAIQGDGNDVGDIWKNAQLNNLTEQVGESPNIKTVILIPGEAKNSIAAKVLIYSITPSNSGNTIKVKFSISFKDNSGGLLSNSPVEGNYKIWLMGNDTFGFTPYDNYEDKDQVLKTAVHNRWKTNETIRYFDQWINTSQSWNLNFDVPAIEKFSLSPSESSSAQLIMEWGFTPDPELLDEFSNTVINLYKSEGLNIDPIAINVNDNGGATAVDVNNNFIPEVDGKSSDRVGSLIESSNHYLLKISGGSGDGNATLTINNVGQGILYFTITVFDKGGNLTSISKYPLDLRDWLITQGGLLYSSSIDINVDHGDIAPEGWLDKVKINHDYADLSTELVGIRNSALPTKPSKSDVVKSYMIRPYSTPDPDPGYYTSLQERFNRKKSFMIDEIKYLGNISVIDGSLSAKEVLDTQIAVVERDGSFTVRNSFVCDRQGIFFVNGDLLIEGKILNGTGTENKDACIFIVQGNVIFEQGDNSSSQGFNYDQINAYILSDGIITIGTDSNGDGLYISGGIHSHIEDGVVFGRSLKVADRLRFPALVVNHHSKYGMLAGRIFGKEATIQSTEVGLKPY